MDASRADAKSNYARATVLPATGVLPGIAIWLFSRQLTGQVELWDADAPIWPLSWLLIAVLGGYATHAVVVVVVVTLRLIEVTPENRRRLELESGRSEAPCEDKEKR
jgi:hypothetical protein